MAAMGRNLKWEKKEKMKKTSKPKGLNEFMERET